MEYWHDIITEKSWKVLQDIKERFEFIVIGGWAAYLWTRAMKSKDIDMIIDIEQLEHLRADYELKKNDNLKNYEIKIDEVDIDIYVPYYSRLPIPAEEIKKHISRIEGFTVPKPEVLLILKQDAEKDRSESEKGLKDRIDIMSILLTCGIDFKNYMELIKRYGKGDFYDRLKGIIANFKEHSYLNLTPGEFKKRKEEIIKRMRGI
ncbi:MAG: hypothetical protein R6U32_05415 [Candidatus Woesearchaeota archaeon]